MISYHMKRQALSVPAARTGILMIKMLV